MQVLQHRMLRSIVNLNSVRYRLRVANKVTKPHYSTKPPSSTLGQTSEHVTKNKEPQLSRFDKVLKRTPKFLHRHIVSLRSAPLTHVTAFLVLHELTAVVPLFGLAGAFHYYNWLPTYFSEGAWVIIGVEKFGRYFKKKGWISGAEEHEAERLAEKGDAQKAGGSKRAAVGKWWDRGEGGVQIVVEFATAYAIVKALLLPRLVISVWGAPWFARWAVVPVLNGFKRIFRRKGGATGSR